ncbi:MAG: PHP domain-containing protein [Spirochaetaceae bacterium]|nr:PHP domain-containing protein [Spirochaetaceae bacterium]
MKKYRADLHIHSCLSPCGDYGMYPTAIVKRAIERELDIIAICDHNCSGNVQAVIAAGKRAGLTVLGGMEICSEEEVHLLTLFDNPEDLQKMDDEISATICEKNDPEIFGDQVLFDEYDNILGLEDRLLMSASGYTIEEVVESAGKYKGLVIASHVNREAYGLLGVLGFIPDEIGFDALEIVLDGFPGSEEMLISDLPLVHFSDAHYLNQIGSVSTEFLLEAPTLEEIGMALKRIKGRKVAS